MAKFKLLIPILLLFSSSAFSMGGDGGWVQDWWGNVYEHQVAPQQQQQLLEEELGECGYKLQFYRQKVQEDPNSEYFKYKLEKWTERCQ